ncbi:hypothetical protein evm_012501 [Chilo suppressalis]|nr:hypothetical protein evm_012501 [Chilo suppressalis]
MSAQGGRASPARDGDGSGVTAWLPILGGLAVGAGLIALVYKLFRGGNNKAKCPTINPAKRRWPKDKY